MLMIQVVRLKNKVSFLKETVLLMAMGVRTRTSSCVAVLPSWYTMSLSQGWAAYSYGVYKQLKTCLQSTIVNSDTKAETCLLTESERDKHEDF